MDDEDGKHLAELLGVLSEVDAWAARTNADASRLRPSPRSSLRGDDGKAHPYDLSHAVWHSLSHAVDHLGSLRALLGGAKVIHMYAPFTLVRGALENACAATWLLQPPSRNDRLTRRFRLAIADIGNGEKARQLTGQPAPRTAHRAGAHRRDPRDCRPCGHRRRGAEEACRVHGDHQDRRPGRPGEQRYRGQLEAVQRLRPRRLVDDPERVAPDPDTEPGRGGNRHIQDRG
jgi:hypothetical protein